MPTKCKCSALANCGRSTAVQRRRKRSWFERSVLETMRQPLEEGKVTISRAAGTMTFPSQFMLVAAMNPTPDGKVPGESRCSPREIQNYLNRISGPLLDRIDIHVEVPAVKFRD